MRSASLVTTFALLAATGGTAGAGTPDPDTTHQSGVAGQTPDQPAAMVAPDPVTAASDQVQYGVGVRLRSIWLPKPVLGLFLAHVPAGGHSYGIGADITRRRGDTELQLGFEWEHIDVAEGTYINRGDVVPQDEADYILSPNDSGHSLGWVTFEFTFLHHTHITNWLSFRYGGGAGIGVVTGELDHYNIRCAGGSTNDNPDPGCLPPRFGGQGTYTDPQPGRAVQVAYDLPPVFPVINAIVGFQFKPVDKWTINLEGGIRTLPFVGLESSYFF